MYKKFVLKIIIPDALDANYCTIYLFCNDGNILLPIRTSMWAGESLILARRSLPTVRPHVHDTLRRVILALDASVESVEIYNVLDEAYYAYINLVKSGITVSIDAKLTDALAIAFLFDCPILVKAEVYELMGIKVTKELLRKSLEAMDQN